MYRKFWGLQREPFVDSIDRRFSCLTVDQRQILQEIVKKTVHPGKLIVLNGVSGIGKTQLLKEIELKLNAQGYFVLNEALPSLDSQSLMDFLKRQIENRTKGNGTSACMPFESVSTRSSDLSTKDIPILLVDGVERQNPQEFQDFIENFRRLTFRKGAEASPVLAGNFSPQLLEDWKRFWNFQDRCEYRIPSLDREDIENYIRHRWRKSAGEADRLSAEIFSPILALTGGIPRQINHLCTLSLLVGFSENAETLTEEIVLKAARYSSRIEKTWCRFESKSSRKLVAAEV